MICTFGDTTDIIWWRARSATASRVLATNDELQRPPAGSPAGRGAVAELGGRTARQARAAVADLLRDAVACLGEPRPTEHMVKFYEKGDRPLEIVTSRQWYIRNGAHVRS